MGIFLMGGRIPVVTMVWVVSRIRFKVETSLTRSHTSINSWLNPRQRSPRWRGPHHERQPAHQLIERPSTLIADYGGEKKSVLHRLGPLHFSSELNEPVAKVRGRPGALRRLSIIKRADGAIGYEILKTIWSLDCGRFFHNIFVQ